MLLKQVCCCHLLSAPYVRSFQNKFLLGMFPFLSNNCREMGNMRTGTEIVNPCIDDQKIGTPCKHCYYW